MQIYDCIFFISPRISYVKQVFIHLSVVFGKISAQIKSLGRHLRVQTHIHISSPMRLGLCLEMSLGSSSGEAIPM